MAQPPGTPLNGPSNAGSPQGPNAGGDGRPTTWPELVWRVIERPRRPLSIAAGLIGATAVVLVVAQLLLKPIFGVNVFAIIFGKSIAATSASFPGPLGSCIESARARARPYVLASVAQYVRVTIDKGPDGAPATINDVRIAYLVLPLHDIHKNEGLFTETYGSKKMPPYRWHGSEEEQGNVESGSFRVLFGAKEYEARTIVTGARTITPAEMEGQTYFNDKLAMKKGEDAWTYDNTEDVICNLTMVIDSPTLVLEPVGGGGLKVAGGDPEPSVVSTHGANEQYGPNTLSARWSDVLPGEIVGIHFRKTATAERR